MSKLPVENRAFQPSFDFRVKVEPKTTAEVETMYQFYRGAIIHIRDAERGFTLRSTVTVVIEKQRKGKRTVYRSLDPRIDVYFDGCFWSIHESEAEGPILFTAALKDRHEAVFS